MNRFITLLAVLFVLPVSSGQIHVYNNLLSATLYYKIGAKPLNGNAYPRLYSLGPTVGHFVSLGPSTYTLYENPLGFPFSSSASSPVITTWERQLTATSTPINTASALAQTLFGATHGYSQFKFNVENGNGISIGSGNIDPLDLTIPSQANFGENMTMIATYFPFENGDVAILID